MFYGKRERKQRLEARLNAASGPPNPCCRSAASVLQNLRRSMMWDADFPLRNHRRFDPHKALCRSGTGLFFVRKKSFVQFLKFIIDKYCSPCYNQGRWKLWQRNDRSGYGKSFLCEKVLASSPESCYNYHTDEKTLRLIRMGFQSKVAFPLFH